MVRSQETDFKEKRKKEKRKKKKEKTCGIQNLKSQEFKMQN